MELGNGGLAMSDGVIGRLTELQRTMRRKNEHYAAGELFDLIRELEQVNVTAAAIRTFTERQERGEMPFESLEQYLSWIGARSGEIKWALMEKKQS